MTLGRLLSIFRLSMLSHQRLLNFFLPEVTKPAS